MAAQTGAAPRAAGTSNPAVRFLGRQRELIGVLLVLGIMPFAFRMAPENFAPFLMPELWRFLGEGVLMVIAASVVAILVSLPLAVVFALARLSPAPWLRWPSVAYVETIRALPLLLVIFYIFLKMPSVSFGFFSREMLAVTAALIIYTASVNAELIRAGILALDKGQTEAARSLGLSYWQALRYIILPQTYQRVLPPLLAQFTILLKDTSLGSIIGMVELLQRGKIIFQGFRNPMETLYIVAILYFTLNFILGRISAATERRAPD